MPGVVSCLLPSIFVAYGLQGIFALVFVPLRCERFYDLCGALGWMSTTYVSLYYPALRAKYWDRIPGITLPSISSFSPRQLLLTAALGLWTLRLGTSLTKRVVKFGGDVRFDEVKKQPVLFAAYWFAQATWITLVGLPVYLTNTVPPFAHPPLGPRDYAAFALFAGSFLFEIIADGQKSKWRKGKNRKEANELLISSRLWGTTSYVGEAGIWAGIYALSTASLQSPVYPRWTMGLAAASPLSIYFLHRYVSLKKLSIRSLLETPVGKTIRGSVGSKTLAAATVIIDHPPISATDAAY